MGLFNIAIVGGGRTGSELINLFKFEEMFDLVAVVDKDKNAAGIELAKTFNVPTYEKIQDIYSNTSINFILDCTHEDKVTKEILQTKSKDISVFSGREIELIRNLLTKSHDKKNATVEQQIRNNYIIQGAMSSLLRVSLAEVPLQGIMLKALKIILGIPLFEFESKGCIFIVNKQENRLEMIAQIGLSDTLISDCKHVNFGECLCGKAAVTRTIEFQNHVTEDHKKFAGMSEHGHYCVPIISAGVLQGILNLYVPAAHERTPNEDEFLRAMADTLAGVIKRKQTEELLFKNKIELEKTLLELEDTQEIVIQRECLAAVGQLAAGVAHDFNNLLSTMIGTAEVMNMSDNISEESRAAFGTIIEQGFKAADLVSQIMDFSRQSVSKMQSIDLVDSLAKTIRLLRRTLPEKIEIIFNHESVSNCFIEADATQLQQVFLNLAINARDAMPDGGKIIFTLDEFILEEDMTAPYPSMQNGQWWRITIQDTGKGMDQTTIKKVFEPFFSTKGEEGTGLGLAQVYGLIKKHGGFVTVDSVVSKGTIFKIFLPAILDDTKVDGSEQKKIAKGQGETILLVEDSKELLSVISKMINNIGYKVIQASNGEEAFDLYKKHKDEIALVLTDMVMPQMDGAQLFEKLKEIDPEVQVIVITGYAGKEKGKELLEKGVLDWMKKPIKLLDLAKTIRAVMGRPNNKS